MKPVLVLGPLAVATLLSWGSSARAEQFIVTDVSYTHSGATTTDSHYRVSPSAETPKNWKSPVDYSTGSVHVLLEVKTKPGATPTKFQICFEGTPEYVCTDQSPTYTATGTYQWTTKFSDFYIGGGGVDWTKGVSKVALILKDTNNNKPQGDPNYVPTDLHVEVAVISAGSSFVAPLKDAGAPPPQDAGASDAGAPRADAGEGGTARPAGDAGRGGDAGSDSGSSEPVERDAGAGGGGDAAVSGGSDSDAAPGSASGGSNSGSSNGKDAGGSDEEDDGGDGGCSVTPGARSDAGGLWLGLSVVALAVRRRARRRS